MNEYQRNILFVPLNMAKDPPEDTVSDEAM